MSTNIRMWLDPAKVSKVRDLTSDEYKTQKEMILSLAEEITSSDWVPEQPPKQQLRHYQILCDEEAAKKLRVKAAEHNVSVSEMFRQYIESK